MKTLAKLLMPLAAVALMVTGAGAAGHFTFTGLGDYEKGVPSQVEKSGDMTAFYTGKLVGLNDANREIVVKTVVPGILGPEEVETPYRLNEDTTITVCINSLMQCVSSPNADKGFANLSTFEERTSFALAEKNVVIIGDPDDVSRIVHVQVDYVM